MTRRGKTAKTRLSHSACLRTALNTTVHVLHLRMFAIFDPSPGSLCTMNPLQPPPNFHSRICPLFSVHLHSAFQSEVYRGYLVVYVNVIFITAVQGEDALQKHSFNPRDTNSYTLSTHHVTAHSDDLHGITHEQQQKQWHVVTKS
jgi:hypothetical protein